MSKKGVSLSFETVIIAIIILVVLVLTIYLVIKFGGTLGSTIGQQAKASITLLPNITAP